jgi:hypothetical protein
MSICHLKSFTKIMCNVEIQAENVYIPMFYLPYANTNPKGKPSTVFRVEYESERPLKKL